MKNNFFTLLKQKLEKNPTKQMDQEFWLKYEQKFVHTNSKQSWFRLPQIVATLSLVLIAVFFTRLTMQNSFNPNEMTTAIMMEQDLLEDIEMIEFMAENDLTPEEMALLMEENES